MLVSAKCPNCGASLNVDKDKDCAICEHCGSPFIVQKAINNINVTNVYNGNITYKSDKSFEQLQKEANIVISKFEYSHDKNALNQLDSIASQILSIRKDSFVGNFSMFYSYWNYRKHDSRIIESLDGLGVELLHNLVDSAKSQEQIDYMFTFFRGACKCLRANPPFYKEVSKFKKEATLLYDAFIEFALTQDYSNNDVKINHLCFIKDIGDECELIEAPNYLKLCKVIKKTNVFSKTIVTFLLALGGVILAAGIIIAISMWLR